MTPFQIPTGDPLENEHRVVSTWVNEAATVYDPNSCYKEPDLKILPSGQTMLAASPDMARRYVMAAIVQARHWESQCATILSKAKTEDQKDACYSHPSHIQNWGNRRFANSVIASLMRRAIPFENGDLLSLLSWCCASDNLNKYLCPLGGIIQALKRHIAANGNNPDLEKAMREFAALLRKSYDKDSKQLGTTVEQLCGPEIEANDKRLETTPQTPPEPATAGSPHVLHGLKRLLGMIPETTDDSVEFQEPDGFPLHAQSPLLTEHRLLTAFMNSLMVHSGWRHPKGALKPDEMAPTAFLMAAAERHVAMLLPRESPAGRVSSSGLDQELRPLIEDLLKKPIHPDRQTVFDLLLYLAMAPSWVRNSLENFAGPVKNLLAYAENEAARSPFSEGERFVLSLVRAAFIPGPPLGKPSAEAMALTRLIGDHSQFFLAPGEFWSDSINNEMSQHPAAEKARWASLLAHTLTARTSRPSAKWLATAKGLIAAVGEDKVRDFLLRVLPMLRRGRTIPKLRDYAGDTRGLGDTIHDENADCLRGLLWCVPLLECRKSLVREIAGAALEAYRKIPGIGPRAVKVGNAAVYALAAMPTIDTVGQLAILKSRVKFGTAQKEIEQAFNMAASALELPRDQIEELGVPSFGMEEVGHQRQIFGNHVAELAVTGSGVELRWLESTGKHLKTIPSKIRKEHPEELKELLQTHKDIQAILPAQRERIDGLFLLRKSWPLHDWEVRYLNHPLIGTIARRLIWCVDGTPAFFVDGIPCNVTGAAIRHSPTAEITLWHPLERNGAEILAWRRRLDDLKVTQPFKQAHREIYLLTDAERITGTYSNRFAAHILRQHQFNALCGIRGWRNKLRLMVDGVFPPASKELPQWGLRAEFLIEGIGEEYGTATNDSGVYTYLSTDQVRFYPTGSGNGPSQSDSAAPKEKTASRPDSSTPLPLTDVPPLVFSEIMRDIDLFVGVASVGNDPQWQDGGPEGNRHHYWQQYAFGELSATAVTRRQVLEQLIPRLKIAGQCSLSERFLVVHGSKRTYKIHLGSGNVLMEPDSQYLCIVPDRSGPRSAENIYLPFEGDATLSLIISKALLLADDSQIKDPSIARQINQQ